VTLSVGNGTPTVASAHAHPGAGRRYPLVVRHATAPDGHHPRRGWLARLAAAWALACSLGLVLADPAPVAMPASAPTAPTVAATDTQLIELDNASRAQPRAAAARLGAWTQALSPTDPRRAPALALRGALLAGRGDSEGAQRVAEAIESALDFNADPLAQASARHVRASMAARQGDLRRADRLLTEASALLPADAPVPLRLRLLRLHGQVKEDRARLDESVRLRQEAIRLADTVGQPWHQVDTRTELAYVLHLAGQHDRGAALNEEAMALAVLHDDALSRARTFTMIAVMADGHGNDPAELHALTRAIEEARLAGSREVEVLGMANLADFYLTRGDFPTALALSRQALPLTRETAQRSAEGVAQYNIGLALLSMHRLAEGMAAVKLGMDIQSASGSLPTVAGLHEELANYLERAGYLAEAYAEHQRHRQMEAEVSSQAQERAVLELQEGFDHERRQRELALLQVQNRLKATDLQHQQLVQRLWLAGTLTGVLLLVLLAVLLGRLRKRNLALKEGNARLQTQSERDPLTGLANRRHLQRLMHREGEEDAFFEGSLLLIDLDHFKLINDRHGHAAGDAVLAEVARRLCAVVREGDLVVRWGGEEFLIVARGLSDEQTQSLAARVLQAVGGAPVVLGDAPGQGASVPVTTSIGCATFPIAPAQLALAWEHAIDLVDTALYLAKAHGRNLAYGIGQVQATSESALAEISHDFEGALATGRVALVAMRGPEDRGLVRREDPAL